MDKREIVKSLKETLENHIEVEKIYMFGSRARGDYNSESDYDIAVVSPDFEKKSFQARQEEIRPIVREVLGLVSLDVVCYTPEEFEEGQDAFLPGIVVEEGVPI